MYSEVTSTAKEDNPQPAVEQFLALHASLSRASLVTNSLSKTAVTSPDQPAGGNTIPEDTLKISADKRRRATSWVYAALATDLSPLSLYHHKPHAPPLSSAASASTSTSVAVVLDSPSKTTAASSKAKSRSSPSAVPASSASGKPSPATTSQGKARGAAAAPQPSPPPEWARGGGLEEGAELARALREEARRWFLGFVERFLDADVAAQVPSDREQVAGMLSQLKRVNDWLDTIGRRREGDEATGAATAEEEDRGGEGKGVPEETIERLRKKIYEYLLAHVESAAVALGSGSPAAAVERPGRKG